MLVLQSSINNKFTDYYSNLNMKNKIVLLKLENCLIIIVYSFLIVSGNSIRTYYISMAKEDGN